MWWDEVCPGEWRSKAGTVQRDGLGRIALDAPGEPRIYPFETVEIAMEFAEIMARDGRDAAAENYIKETT
jgi:hypothetical protein